MCCVGVVVALVQLQSYLHPHETSVLLQLPPHLRGSQPADVEHQVLPLDGLEDVRVVRHVKADLDLRGAPQRVRTLPRVGGLGPRLRSTHLLQAVLVPPVGALKVGHQLPERAVPQRFVHQVRAPAHPQRTVAPPAVHTQHHMVETMARELSLEANGEALQGRQSIGQVTDRGGGVKGTTR